MWTKLFPKVIGADGKVVKGATSYAFQPSLQPGSRPLCIDVTGDSQQAGAALELRPCDGTPSQAFVFLTNDVQTFVRNAGSGLQMTVEADGTVVQRGFFKRVPNETPEQSRERNRLTNTQLFRVGPREFGVGGA
ncbi:RICIN domain-containing protein [Dactylosporangium aurantiacum]|uniref:RICIN domain-containing protein n=1 Tax=Dactylosporangium aurantiacum TaxID=35754 RepID=A0A9Q9IK03_9ACTN|nr:RICIN domain-containing protein [Dactylosporangium aurantiacum]MDG6103057.1 RICIN domain-containing protein [Dactylosporangium aurantiacum]UWZ57569.1 RICIN domain-containing protein [Dactylosporangium aurantiacum]